MRLLLITWACDRDDISEPRTSYTWVHELSKDHEVTLLCCSKRDRFGSVKEQLPNVTVIEWKDIWLPTSFERFRAIVKPGYVLYYIKVRRFLKKYLADNKFDAIHQLSPFAWRYPSPATGFGVPLIRGPVAGGLPTPTKLEPALSESKKPFDILRKSDNFRKHFDPVLRSSYRKIDLLMVAAPYVLDLINPLKPRQTLLEAEHGLAETALNIDLPAKEYNPEIIKLLFVGRAIRTKGLKDTIRALSKITNLDRIHLTIIGDGDDLQSCKKEAETLNLMEKIHFFGWGSREEVHKHYCQADVFICPTFREPVGVVFLEAMSYGLPSITCSYGGPDYLIDETSGIRVPPVEESDFSTEIAKAIDRLVEDPKLRQTLAKGALERANNYFDWPTKRKRMTGIYEDLIENMNSTK